MIEWVAGGLALLGAAGWITAYRSRRRDRRALHAAQGELARRLNELFSLQELSYVLSESLEVDRIAEQITGYITRFFETGGSLVALPTSDHDGIRIAAAAGSLAALAGQELTAAEAGALMDAMQQERLELIEPEGPETFLAGVSVERAVVAPLRAHGLSVGSIAVVDRRTGAFTSEDLRLLSTVATHAAIVLSNARFFELVQRGRDQWETTFDALEEGVAVLDEHNRVRRANRALADLVRRSASSLADAPFADLLLGPSMELAELLAAAHAGTAPAPLVIHSERLGRLLQIAAAPIRGMAEAVWIVTMVSDVTEQRAIESQLIQSEKMAAVGQLVSGVAHELNNPLTSIAGLAELLLEQGSGSERDREHLHVIREQADRAGQIVHNLLTFARKGPAAIEPIDLNDVVERTVALVGYELNLREIQLETQLDRALPPITGDRYQIQQVVVNLVTNAVQAVAANPPHRPRRIRLTTAHDAADVTLSVADTGPGIPEELAPQIFTPFYTTKGPGQGTGLGLSISYQIVEGHEGTITVQQALDGGAVFLVKLPVAREPTAPAPAPAPLAPETPAPPAPERHHDVLLLDDDPAVRRMIGVLLSAEGMTVTTARDGADAVRLLGTHDGYDLIIADPRAAVSAGERFAERLIREWPHLRDHTILLTADVRPETDAWLRQTRCRYFQKPFKISDLKAAVAEILD